MATSALDFAKLVEPGVHVLAAEQIPANFIRILLKSIEKKQATTFLVLPISNSADWQQAKSRLEMSFLGQQAYYWLSTFDLDLKLRRELCAYLNNYEEPHAVLLFSKASDLPEELAKLRFDLDAQGGNLVARLLSPTSSFRVEQFLKQVQHVLKTSLTVEQAATLIPYAELTRDFSEFDLDWLSLIVPTEQSLFDLSKFFLFRDRLSFYNLWQLTCAKYAPQFWIAFWSEQIFRAHWFIFYQKKQDHVLAKQIGSRLPFDFVKTGWRYLDVGCLIEAHDLLYQIDWQLKQGGSELWLELFFNNFFNA